MVATKPPSRAMSMDAMGSSSRNTLTRPAPPGRPDPSVGTHRSSAHESGVMATLRGCREDLPSTFPGHLSLRKSADRCHPYVHPEPTEDTMHRDEVREITGGEEPLDERLLVLSRPLAVGATTPRRSGPARAGARDVLPLVAGVLPL